MTRRTTQAEAIRIIRNAQAVTNFVLGITNGSSDYLTLLITVLGNGVSAFASDETDEVFEAKLSTVHTILDQIARHAREKLLEAESLMETRH
jgi:hypothetical protein